MECRALRMAECSFSAPLFAMRQLPQNWSVVSSMFSVFQRYRLVFCKNKIINNLHNNFPDSFPCVSYYISIRYPRVVRVVNSAEFPAEFIYSSCADGANIATLQCCFSVAWVVIPSLSILHAKLRHIFAYPLLNYYSIFAAISYANIPFYTVKEYIPASLG